MSKSRLLDLDSHDSSSVAADGTQESTPLAYILGMIFIPNFEKLWLENQKSLAKFNWCVLKYLNKGSNFNDNKNYDYDKANIY